jgi:endoribonuclease LACTB2
MSKIFDDSSDFIFLQGEDRGRPPYSNSLVIDDILIDTGISKRLLKEFRKNHKISKILLSHWHEDHISGNSLFPEAEFYIHKNDAPVLQDVKKIALIYGIHNTNIEDQFMAYIESFRIKDIQFKGLFEDGDTFTTSNGLKIQVIFTPGHSAGHCCFYEPKSKVIFLADIDLSSFGPWYGCLDSNLLDFEKSLEKIKAYSIECAISSHTGIIRGKEMIQERLEAYQGIIKERDERILSYLNTKTPVTATDLMGKNIVYNRYNFFKDYLIIAEKIMIENHFQKLLKENKIASQGNGYCLTG